MATDKNKDVVTFSVSLDKDLHRQLKIFCVTHDTTIKEVTRKVLEQGIQKYLQNV